MYYILVYFMPLVLSNLHMNNLWNDIASTIKQFVDDVLLPFITLNAKTWVYELNPNLKNKSEWTLCDLLTHIWTNRLRQVIFWRTTKSYHSQTCFNNILRIYLNEKLNFYHHTLVRNAQMYTRLENLFTRIIFL